MVSGWKINFHNSFSSNRKNSSSLSCHRLGNFLIMKFLNLTQLRKFFAAFSTIRFSIIIILHKRKLKNFFYCFKLECEDFFIMHVCACESLDSMNFINIFKLKNLNFVNLILERRTFRFSLNLTFLKFRNSQKFLLKKTSSSSPSSWHTPQ